MPRSTGYLSGETGCTPEARHPIHKGMIKVIPYEAIEQFERTYVLAWELAESLNLR